MEPSHACTPSTRTCATCGKDVCSDCSFRGFGSATGERVDCIACVCANHAKPCAHVPDDGLKTYFECENALCGNYALLCTRCATSACIKCGSHFIGVTRIQTRLGASESHK